MMAKNIPKMPLPKLDDLFTTEEERTNDKLEKVVDIKISDIDDFPDHPFKVIENEDMFNMRDSIN
jgi:ParB family chromosome partitioning protein